jgi:hypothetical protein
VLPVLHLGTFCDPPIQNWGSEVTLPSSPLPLWGLHDPPKTFLYSGWMMPSSLWAPSFVGELLVLRVYWGWHLHIRSLLLVTSQQLSCNVNAFLVWNCKRRSVTD